MDLALQAAQAQLQDPPLTPAQRQMWNGFVDYLEKTGYKGSKMLDDKNTALGGKLIEQYKTINPEFSLDYNAVKQVQQDLQDYRQQSLNRIKAGKAQFDGKEEDFMPGLSKIDGWLGSKTSSWKFPEARLTRTTDKGTEVKKFGTDLAAYDAAMYKH